MPQDYQSSVQNRILAALPSEEYERLLSKLEKVDLELRQTLFEPRKRIEYVYFLNNGIASLLNIMANGQTAEVGLVGYEGMVGLPAFLGAETVNSKAIVQIQGNALRMPVDDFREEANRHGSLHRLLQRYTQALLMQVSQTAACNRFHTLEERFCRWVLMTYDRTQSDTFPLTQDFLSKMLGARRPSISVVATLLQRAELIRYSRGKMTVTNRQGLEEGSCECYEIVREDFERLLGGNVDAEVEQQE